MLRSAGFAIAVLLATAFTCAAEPSPTTVVVLVRHAEAVPDGGKDRDLSAAGRARAAVLAETLGSAGIERIITSQFVRTRETARPLAEAHALVPEVIQAGLVVGGEYGEGALRVGGETVEYYSTAAGSFGLQAGAQAKTIIICFMQEEALDKFRASSGWEAGVDGSVALIELGAGGSLDTTTVQDPIVAFVIGRRGLMVNLSLEGSKFTKLVR